jgi:hypothetical protein
VARVVEDRGDAVGHLDLRAVIAAAHLRHRLLDVVLVVERLPRLGTAFRWRRPNSLGERFVVGLDVGCLRLRLDRRCLLLGVALAAAVPALAESRSTISARSTVACVA